MVRIFFLILLGTLSFVIDMDLWAQSGKDTLVFHHVTTGMSRSSATKMFEDSQGFLWIGTPNGINRYDGSRFDLFEKESDSIAKMTNGYVKSLYEDGDGILYFGTNQGLNTYDRKMNKVMPYPLLGEGEVLKSKYIRSILRIDDHLLLGTDHDGVFRYNIKTGETKQLLFEKTTTAGLSGNTIVDIYPLEDNTFLVVTQLLTYIINDSLEVITQTARSLRINCTTPLDEATFLLGTYEGEMVRLKVDDDDQFNLATLPVTPGFALMDMETGPNNNIWIASENAGLSIYNPSTGALHNIRYDGTNPNSIPGNSIWSIYKAKNGVMWLGGFKKGLSFYDTKYHKFNHHKYNPARSNSLSNDLVNCFMEVDTDTYWIGTDGGGVNVWNRKENTFEEYSLRNGKLHTDVVLSLLKDNIGRFWVGSWAKGVSIIDPRTNKSDVLTQENSFLTTNHVLDIIQDKKGRIWMVTLRGGAHLYNPQTGDFEYIELISSVDGTACRSAAHLLEDKYGHIWVGTHASGLFKISEDEGGRWTVAHYHTHRQKGAISSNYINTLMTDADGTIWVGTQAGLNIYDVDSDSFSAVTKKDGLHNEDIKGVLQDGNGYLWLSTSNGILQYDPTDSNVLHYDLKDGLQEADFSEASYYKTSSGDFFFGGSNGFNSFSPEHVKKRNDVPKIFISGLRIFNQKVTSNDAFGVLQQDIRQTDSLTLNYDQDVVGFEFNALTFRHPERVNFAYFLEGFEDDWNYVGNNQYVTYTNLNPGNYTLRIKSTNSDGIWVDNEISVSVAVAPPFWATWWFRCLMVIAVLLTGWLLHRIRVSNLEKYQATLEQKIAERTFELEVKHKKLIAAADELFQKNEEIQRFAFAVSHDLKSPLNSIKGLISLMSPEITARNDSKQNTYLNYINDACDMMGNLIEDITKIAKLGKVENKNELLETDEVLGAACNMVQGKLIKNKVSLHIEEGLPKIVGDRNRIIQVFENLIDNSIKYMGDQGDPKIWVKSQMVRNENQILVIDNGSGMDEKALGKLFTPFERFHSSVEGTGLGLYMVKKIVESHNGTISGASGGRGKGTTFTLGFPTLKTGQQILQTTS